MNTLNRVSRTAGNSRVEINSFHNPLNGGTNQPRIPDGKATTSLGMRNQNVWNTIQTETRGQNLAAGVLAGIPANPTQTLHICLYAGLSSGAAIYNTAQVQDGRDSISDPSLFNPYRDYYVMGYQDHGTMQSDQSLAEAHDSSTNYPYIQNMTNVDNYAKWRTVSQAAVLKLVNSTDENDGWWESVRLSEPLGEDEWMVTTKNNGSAEDETKDACLAPLNKFVKEDLGNRNIANEPHYSTGRLKDIHKVKFELLPTTDEIEFTTMADQYRLQEQLPNGTASNDNVLNDIDARFDEHGIEGPGATASSERGNSSDMRLQKGSSRANRLLTDWVDHTHDMIYIRIHCRANNRDDRANEEHNGSQIMLQLVANQEIMFSTEQRESKYQIKGHSLPMGPHFANKKRKSLSSALPIVDADMALL